MIVASMDPPEFISEVSGKISIRDRAFAEQGLNPVETSGMEAGGFRLHLGIPRPDGIVDKPRNCRNEFMGVGGAIGCNRGLHAGNWDCLLEGHLQGCSGNRHDLQTRIKPALERRTKLNSPFLHEYDLPSKDAASSRALAGEGCVLCTPSSVTRADLCADGEFIPHTFGWPRPHSMRDFELDGDMSKSTSDLSEAFRRRIAPGGACIIDDCAGIAACRSTEHDFRERHPNAEPFHPNDWTGAHWRKENHQ
jgi:hypothetical protein